ncbi:MAG: hypothetical protein V7723_04440 [Sneathiella sp.]|uniref:hypothetical protein n=1 Tax=Sneathiella sp. TaxID=1964365 RepID=UPI003002F816
MSLELFRINELNQKNSMLLWRHGTVSHLDNCQPGAGGDPRAQCGADHRQRHALDDLVEVVWP